MKKALAVALVATLLAMVGAVLLFYATRDPMMLIFGFQIIVLAWTLSGGVWLLRRWKSLA